MDRSCSVNGCSSPKKAKGFCTKHYHRFIRNGSPDIVFGHPPINFPNNWEEILTAKYCVDGLSAIDIAAEYKCHKTTILDQLNKFGIKRRKFRRDNPVKVCTSVDSHGYVIDYIPAHVNAEKSGYVFQHVRVMSDHLKRKIERDEIVHHIDGNRKNNDLSNLKLMRRGEHSSFHEREKSLGTRRGIVQRINGWVVTIGIGGKIKYVGFYHSYEEAVKMRKEAELKFWGETCD